MAPVNRSEKIAGTRSGSLDVKMKEKGTQPLVESLTQRDMDVLALLAAGKTNRQIAEELVLAISTVKWYARQVYGKLGVGSREEAAERAADLGLVQLVEEESQPRHNLPAQLTPFVGRQQELAALRELLADPAVRLLTIVGPGGMGKTRLALEAVSVQLGLPQAPRDGVFFVRLAQVDETEGIAPLLAEILDLGPVAGESDPALRLRRYLREKQMLLLLDNVEHLVGPDLAGWLDELLAAAGEVTVLVTSRQRVNVRGEHLHWMKGLQLPLPEMDGQQPDHLLEASSALTLFLQTARRVQSDFVLTPKNYPAVSEICRLTEGMPLGIELAAAWMGLLTPGELLHELRQTPDILVTEAGNAAPGQRSLRAVFETSWRLLTQPERQAIRALSYFRGGFTRQAAETVCDVTLKTLLALVNKCWLKRDADGRFSMHELLRQYGAEALAAQAGYHDQVRKRHAAYYCDWLVAQQEAMVGSEQEATLAAVSGEIGNIRLASLAALETGRLARLAPAVHVLGLYYRWHGGYLAGDNFLASLLHAVADHAGSSPVAQLVRARLLVWRMTLHSHLGQYQRSEALAREVLALLEELEQAGQGCEFERMQIASARGYNALLGARRAEQALHYFSEAHRFAQSFAAPWEAHILVAVARARRNLGELEEAERVAAQVLPVLRERGGPLALTEALALHGSILALMGRLPEAEASLQESVQLASAHPGIEAFCLYNLGWVYYLQGRFERAATFTGQAADKLIENEIWLGSVLAPSHTELQQGHYSAAVQIVARITPALTPSWQVMAQAVEAYLRGAAALAEAEWRTAGEQLRRSLTLLELTPDYHYRFPYACLALVHRASGCEEEAAQSLATELRMTLASHTAPALLFSLLVAALILSDRGEVERATQIYTRVWQEPFAHNSVWLAEVAGQELEEIAAHLPAGARAAAEGRGRSLDLWETAAALLGEFDDLASLSSSTPGAGE